MPSGLEGIPTRGGRDRLVLLVSEGLRLRLTLPPSAAAVVNADPTPGAASPHCGVSQALLGTTKRPGGTVQVTYNGHPLYYFIGDKAAGAAKGQGLKAFGAGWYVVSASGSKIDTS